MSPAPPVRPPRPLLPLALILSGAGVLAMLVAWIKVASTVEVERQVSWTGLSMVGAVLVCAGAALAATSGERVFLLRLHRLGAAVAATGPDAASTGRVDAISGDGLVAAPTMARYHRPDCPLVSGKPVTAATQAEHERAGRRACGVCGA